MTTEQIIKRLAQIDKIIKDTKNKYKDERNSLMNILRIRRHRAKGEREVNKHK